MLKHILVGYFFVTFSPTLIFKLHCLKFMDLDSSLCFGQYILRVSCYIQCGYSVFSLQNLII